MTTEGNRMAAVRFVESLGTLDPDVVGAQMTDDGIYEMMCRADSFPMSRRLTREELCAQLGEQRRTMFPEGLRMAALGSTVEGDRVSVESESRAMAPGGRIYSNVYHWLIHLRDGKVALAREYADFLHAKEVFFD